MQACPFANICTQFMDHIGHGLDTPDQLLPYLRQIFRCIRQSGLIFPPEKRIFRSEQCIFLGNFITEQGLNPKEIGIDNFLKALEKQKSVKEGKILIGFLQ